uniref:Uncharacterized protein n=1 Tax=Arundo donax TaxID=35708 RepID=A0A0A8Z373_ARUDO
MLHILDEPYAFVFFPLDLEEIISCARTLGGNRSFSRCS